jgi:uncharacterized membrane protein YgdD (TMEM256/DUF423 family)
MPLSTRRSRLWFALGAVNGLAAVGLGAYGAHAFAADADADTARIFDTAVRYHMWHGLALLAVGIAAGRHRTRLIHLAGLAFTAGILLFCGSLYALSLTGDRLFPGSAPIGGAALILGWALLAFAVFRPHHHPST